MVSMEREYETLRAEMLQLFTEQSQLAFATALSSGAILFGILQSDVPASFGVTVWLILLVGIAYKLAANYDKVYRIGTYLKVVHEHKACQNSPPVGFSLGWHFRSRILGGRVPGWKWGTGARTEALFLRLLGLSGLLFTALSMLAKPDFGSASIAGNVAVILFYLLLVGTTRRLYGVKECMAAFESELWTLLTAQAHQPMESSAPEHEGPH